MHRKLSCVFLSLLLCLSLAFLDGCSLVHNSAADATSSSLAVKATGMVHGGQQPVTGSTIQLYAVGTTGYGSTPTALIGGTITTSDGTNVVNSNANAGNANNSLPAGFFTINGAYTCPTSSTLVYLVATGGNPGLTAGTNNSAIVMLSALGQCGSLSSLPFVTINEVTTVGSLYALAQFSNVNGNIGSVSSGDPSIASAFANVNNMVNIATGAALSTTGSSNAVPQSEINTLADILVPCINSTGPTSTSCTSLFSAIICCTTPTTVLNAALDIALNPRSNVNAIFSLASANAAFQPTLGSAPNNWEVVVGGAAQSTCGYSGSGYVINGTVNYSGTQTGRIYLAASNNTCSGGGTQGTSMPSKGGYTIRSVPPGTYTVFAFMDTQGAGVPNAADPTGSATVTISASNASVNVTLTDPSTVTVTSSPNLQTVSPFNGGVLIVHSAAKNSNGVETATSYTLQWSTSSSFSTIAGRKVFAAGGATNSDVWAVNGLTDGSIYYFRAYGTSAGTAIGPYTPTYGPVTIGAPSTGSAVSGTVTFAGAVTGPMYAGLFNQYTSTAYLQYIANPVSAQAYTVTVPNSATAVYKPVALIDQNGNGLIDAGDLQNTNIFGSLVSVTGPTSNVNQSLPSGNSIATVTTQSYSSGSYVFNLQVNTGAKLPVAVWVLSSSNADGANVVGPMDIALCGQAGTNCGQGFQISFNLGTTAPTVGDTYFFTVIYSDQTSEKIAASVTGVLSSFASGLAPTTGTSTSTTPTFSWTAPVCGACSSYVYQFDLQQTNGNDIWDVPGNANGLPYTTTSLVWSVDPTASFNPPSVGSLTLATNYTWSVSVVDSNGNRATTQASYTP